MYGSAEALPRLTPNWEKRFLDLTDDGCAFKKTPLPLAAVYLLGERSTRAAASAVEHVAAPEALLALVANTYVNYLPDAKVRAREFESLGNVVSTVTVKRAMPPAEPRTLPSFCDRIVDDVQHC